ncbi:MAG: DUF4358 domain-containing protein [Oscillospiraceae bacterium]|jgi:hypothetical protein|nr:DUF4358 domain-containing protein [Oscillospiraceae bacterium]
MKGFSCYLSVFMAAALCLFAACAGGGGGARYTAAQMAEAMLITQKDLPELNSLAIGDDSFSGHLAGFYGLDSSVLSDGAVFYAGGGEATEVAVFELGEGAELPKIEEALLSYLEARAAALSGYAPREAALAEGGTVLTKGGYITLVICAETSAATAAFLACLDGSPGPSSHISAAVSEVPDREDEPAGLFPGDDYDHGAILAALRTGGGSSLSPGNRAALEACEKVLSGLGKGLTRLEKTQAIHDWIVSRTEYDKDAIELPPGSPPPDPDDETPYGPLLKGKATCMGYALTFQLFMDMLEIPCVTVEGTSGGGKVEHAWNMVELDGEWRHIDVTWDDPVGFKLPGTKISREFFNVSDEFLREKDHQWDESQTPPSD